MNRNTLVNEILKAENGFSSLFSEREEFEHGTRYTDNELPDMHCHNFFRLKNDRLGTIQETVRSEAAFRKSNNQKAVQLEIFDAGKEEAEAYVSPEDLTVHEVMYVEIGNFREPERENKALVEIAAGEEAFAMGKEIDCIAFGEEMRAFAAARYERKKALYGDKHVKLYNFICHRGEEPIGNCDFFIDGRYGKIEDLDVLEKHQRQGYGTEILHAIKEFAQAKGVEILFLQVEEDNGAIELYRKCGFRNLCRNIIYFKED